MKTSLFSKITLGTGALTLASFMLAGSVFAQNVQPAPLSGTAGASVSASASVSATASGQPMTKEARAEAAAANRAARTAARMTTAEQKGVAAIDKRVADLGKLVTRVQAMKNVSDADKATISATVANLSTNLSALQQKIESDTSSTTLRADLTSITGSYRIYALVMPEVSIIAAADRAITIAGMLDTLAVKLNSRLAAAGAISNLASLQASMTDLSAKTAEAIADAQAAVKEVTPLVPDQGDKTVMESNTATLKDARSKIAAAQTALKAAQKDATTVTAALKKIKPTASATATASASVTTNASATTTVR